MKISLETSGATRLERLDECIKKDPNAAAPSEKLHEPGSSEELEETDRRR